MNRDAYRIWYRMRRILKSFQGTSLGMMCGSDPKKLAWKMALEAER